MLQTVNHKSMLIYNIWQKGLRESTIQYVYITFAFQSDERIIISVHMNVFGYNTQTIILCGTYVYIRCFHR